jgi:hypothetical protein
MDLFLMLLNCAMWCSYRKGVVHITKFTYINITVTCPCRPIRHTAGTVDGNVVHLYYNLPFWRVYVNVVPFLVFCT